MRADLLLKLLGALSLGLLPLALIVAVEVRAGELASIALAALVLAVLWLLPSRSPIEEEELDEALLRLEERVGESALERSRVHGRAAVAGRFREEFVAAVRHELKTPLNAILGFGDVLLQEVDGPLDDKQREDVEAIRSAGAYLAELIDAVLAEWRPDRDTPLPLTPVDLGALISEIVTVLSGQLVGRHVELRKEIEPDLPRLLVDARRLRQVLVNLGTNAMRATERGTITFGARAEDGVLRLWVADTGSGIVPEQLPVLFDEFVQAGSESSRDGGSGLGLAIVRELVEWHGGEIEVETKLGEGSTFHVILPSGENA